MAELPPRILIKRLPADSQDYVSSLQNSMRWRTGRDFRHENLPCIRGVMTPSPHPAPSPRGAQGPVVCLIRHGSLGEINRRRLRSLSVNQLRHAGQQNEKRQKVKRLQPIMLRVHAHCRDPMELELQTSYPASPSKMATIPPIGMGLQWFNPTIYSHPGLATTPGSETPSSI